MTDRPRRPSGRRLRAGGAVLLLSVLAALVIWASPAGLDDWRDRVFDRLILALPGPAKAETGVVVVDIGALDEAGRPWDRAASARLAAAIAGARPAAVGWDIVFAGNCGDAPANRALAAAMAQAPTVLGMLLSPVSSAPPRPLPDLALAAGVQPGLWAAPGAEAPCPALAEAAGALASLSLPGDATARVRAVPAAVVVAGAAYPSLPVAVLRLAGALPNPLIAPGAGGGVLHLGAASYPLGEAATLRFRPTPAQARRDRTLDAVAVLTGEGGERLRGAVVLVGSSLPQRGGLRPTVTDPLYPSVQIAADLLRDLQAGRVPWRPDAAAGAEALALVAGGVLAAAMVVALSPLRALAGGLGLALLWFGGAGVVHAATGRLIDPVLPALALLVAATAGVLGQAAASHRALRALRGRLGQLLPEPVVARLADDPGLLRLGGERRQVTALFTDLEGFSALANSLPPEVLIERLDRYFAVVSAVILRHGGMIDKIVGDAVHALFNAPLDQPDHVEAALAAAAAIQAETGTLRAVLGLGRTRIGIETGPAILGDVGSGARIDYTAHGPAVNLAARLQEAGKALGPAVIIGPAAAAAARSPLRPLGPVDIRSFGTVELFTLA
ncbi:MAG: CHASE2 domain-containing protein [Paracoccaceae bacterium]